MAALSLPPTASVWRSSLPAYAAAGISDPLIDAIDRLASGLRATVLARLDRAVSAGVCDERTMETIVEVVCADGGC